VSDDFGDFEGLEGLEDRDFEISVEETETGLHAEYDGPCGGCANCATGSHPAGAGLDNVEAHLDIAEVEFKSNRSGFYLNESGAQLHAGTHVLVEAERGSDLGKVIAIGEAVHEKRRSRGLVGQPIRKALRIANEQDLKQHEENQRIEQNAGEIFIEKCGKHNLAMKLVAVEYQFDHARLTFFFTAESRVDFRALVRDLASVYRTRIELRQIGARDEAKKVGGLGICGREVCCTTWMSQIKRVNLDHARFQSLSLNPSRLAGACGRLKCCILFEMQNYVDSLKQFPAPNSVVVTSKGEGLVEKVDIFNERIYLRYQNTNTLEPLSLDEVKKCQNRSGKDQAQNYQR
jgi:cell fate regulator YaaT (PSP1 superfamily)